MDEFLNQNKPPRPEFARGLYAKLSAKEAAPMAQVKPARRAIGPGLKFALTALAVALGAAVLFTAPQVSSAAQSFLNLFRVKRITAIAFDPARLKALESGVNFNELFAGATEIIKQPGKTVTVTTPAQASAIAGMPVVLPAQLADGYPLGEMAVTDNAVMRITGDTQKAQAVLQLLGITDAQLPSSLNGAKITLNVPRVVAAQYGRGGSAVALAQAQAPEVDLPPDVNMAQLGEIGLRTLGASAADARALAGKIDWNTTLIVPIPINAASFREVNVRGASGLLITTNSAGKGASAKKGNLLMWSEGGKVFALSGDVSPIQLTEMAEAVK